MSGSDKANLARIRDNQRRSRARRKEYLQELETRFRNCELMGVEASAEIQAVARRVADENKRLRLLLQQQGVDEKEIDPLLAGLVGQEEHNSEAPVLNTLLTTRKSCNRGNTERGPQQRSTAPSFSIKESDVRTPPSRLLSTSSAVSSTAFSGKQVEKAAPSDQQIAMSIQQIHSMPSIPSNDNGEFFFDENLISDSPNDQGNNFSCQQAADIVSVMNSAVDHDQISAELGCLPGSECSVDNQTLFAVMDQFSAEAQSM
ncbi:MAG: hypothetical protein M1824_001758 [Vezdaea acicularis]|nr:MAG: hypothetical protein M1824_001758 [Vezdaea acicularis]